MKKMNKRILSALLTVVLLLTNFPLVTYADSGFAITYEGKAVKQVEFSEHEKIAVSAAGKPGGTYQWQIKIPGTDQWVNIQGQTGQTIHLSKAVVGSLMSGGSAQVRCAAVSGGEELDHTAALRVTVNKDEPVTALAAKVPSAKKPAEKPAAPKETPAAPAETPAAPAETPAAPAETPAAPAETPAAPAETPAAPAETPAAPAETPAAPAETPAAPAETPAAPAETPAAPAETPAAPAETPAAPAETPAAPAETPAAPAQTPAAPVETPAAPAERSEESLIKKDMMFTVSQAAGNALDDEESTEIVSVTIDYIYWDRELNQAGSKTWDSYVAYIQKGTNLNVQVPNKVVPGYEPELVSADGARLVVTNQTTKASQIEINLTDVQADTTFTVYYKEVKVPYHARYYVQNVYNDLYVEDTSQYREFEGYQNTDPPLHDEGDLKGIYLDIVGFTPLFHQPEKIAADGSTVFEVYYDRNYYLMNFNMDGGYGTAPVYARYQTSFIVASPTKAGYIFDRWELEKVNGAAATDAQKLQNFPTSIPAENRTYKAIWKQERTSYTVAYWILNDKNTADVKDDIKTFLGSRKVRTTSWTDPVSGKDDLKQTDGKSILICGEEESDKHTHTDECRVDPTDLKYLDYVSADQNVTIKGDGSSVVNVYYEFKEYTLKFYYAMSSGSGSNEKYYVVGGSTYGFGADASINRKDDEVALLSEYLGYGGWYTRTGSAAQMPTLNEAGQSRGYQSGYDTARVNAVDYKYHYISFKARYGDDISDMWPCDVFNSVTMKPGHTAWSNSDQAFVSAWNGEYNVYYSQQNKGNQTIKGNYEKLDYQILWKDKQPSDMTVSYLCFWENGAKIDWSIPELYVYNIWITCRNNKKENAPIDPLTQQPRETKRVEVKDGEYRWFYLDRSYHTCDDSSINKQTRPSLTGYVELRELEAQGLRSTEWGAIFLTEASYQDDGWLKGGGGTYYNPNNDQVKSDTWLTTQKLTIKETGNGKYMLYSSAYDPQKPENGIDHSLYREAFYRDFYYYSKEHTLFFWNHDNYLTDGRGVPLEYAAPLKVYGDTVTADYMKPYYPKSLEPNAYYFDGWYTTPGCLEGTEMDWNSSMPDADVTVYAHWAAKTYDTHFYLDYDIYQNRYQADGTTLDESKAYVSIKGTPHGEGMILGENLDRILYPRHPSGNTNYRFVGWFYINADGEKIAFNPSEMAIRQDLYLYAGWTTRNTVSYTVHYVLGDQDGNIVYDDAGKPYKLADDTVGYGFEATTRTFDAKSSDQLTLMDQIPQSVLNQYKPKGAEPIWLPNTGSHSILLKGLDENGNSPNEFYFVYTARLNVPYTVRYVDAQDHQLERADTQIVQLNKSAVVTEQFVYVEHYIPDAFNKRLILSANEQENVITFYYTKDETAEDTNGDGIPDRYSAHYLITHYVQNIGEDTYSVYNFEDLTGLVGDVAAAEALKITGFTFDPDETVKNQKLKTNQVGQEKVSGKITSGENEGEPPLELELYYTRNQYDYTIRYLERGTNKVLIDGQNLADYQDQGVTLGGTADYKAVITKKAPRISGYEPYLSQENTNGELSVTIGEDKTRNVITFYYTQIPVTINYHTVLRNGWADKYGKTSRNSETPADGESIGGAQAITEAGFRFVGWYEDEACETLITDSSTIVPEINFDDGIYYYDYYALFEPVVLTITQTGMTAGESGVYEIIKQGAAAPIATIMITGNSSVTLEQIPSGTYTIREYKDGEKRWAWTYAAYSGEVTVTKDGPNEVEVKRGKSLVDWLYGEAAR